MLIEPQTPAELRALILEAIDLDTAPDPQGVLAAIDEVLAATERLYTGEQLALTPCQRMMGRVFLDAVLELLENKLTPETV